MGLILPQTIKVKTAPSNCKYFREKGYTFKKCGDIIEVNVLDLQEGSNQKVKIKCDVCGKEREIKYWYVLKTLKDGTLMTCGSTNCMVKKYENTCIQKYNTKSTFESKDIRNKINNTCQIKYGGNSPMCSQNVVKKQKSTNNKKYGGNSPMCSNDVKNKAKITCQINFGVDSPGQSEIIKNKIKETCQARYGCNCTLQNEETKEKIKQTNFKKYGAENPFASEEIKKKIKQTNYEKYGAENPFASEEIKEKIRDTWSFNGHDGPCSRQQKYLANLVNGKINAVISGYWADIVLENEKIDLEYDGGGHNLCVMRKQCTQEEFDLKEKIREESICKKGYKIIRIISKRDNLPSDETILNLIESFKKSDFQVVRIDIDEGTIEKDYNQKTIYNFGKLRRITKKDLESFEKQEEKNTSKTSKN